MIRISAVLVLALAGCPKKNVVDVDPGAVVPEFPDKPEPGAPAVFTPATPTRTELANGIPVYTVSDDSLPLVSVRLVLPTGANRDPSGKYGRATLGSSMLGEGAGERTALEQAAALDVLAANLSIGAGRESTHLSLDVHADRLADALPLAADALLRPRFDKGDWERVKDQHINGLQARLDDNGTVSRVVANRQWWGQEHPYGTPALGTVETATSLTLADVKAWHGSELHAGGASFVVVGAVSSEQATTLLDTHFGAWQAKERSAVEQAAPVGGSKRIFVDRPGATQTVVRVVLPTDGAAAESRAPLDVVSTVMGGSFTSRLNRRLREELGYTYGARMRVDRMRDGGTISSYANIRGDATAHAVTEFVRLLDQGATEGFTADEVARGRAQILTDVVDNAETRAGLASAYADELEVGRAPADIASWLSSLDTVSEAQVDAAGKALATEGAMIVLVGDKDKVGPALAEAGFADWTVVDADGSPVE